MLNGNPVIGSHDDDGHLRPHNAAYSSGCLNPIHSRHFPVNQYHVKIPAFIPELLYPVDCLASAVHPLCLDSHFVKSHNRALAHSHIIIHHQGFQMGEIIILFFLVVPDFLFLCDSQLNIHCKLRADSFDGTDRNLSVHHIHDIFGNGQPQPGSSVQGGGSCGFLRKRLKYMGQKFLAHAHPRIIYNESQRGIVFGFPALGC